MTNCSPSPELEIRQRLARAEAKRRGLTVPHALAGYEPIANDIEDRVDKAPCLGDRQTAVTLVDGTRQIRLRHVKPGPFLVVTAQTRFTLRWPA